MHRRTTVMVGTFALGFAIQSLEAQEPVRPTTGALVAAPRNAAPRVPSNKPRIAGIAPAPAAD